VTRLGEDVLSFRRAAVRLGWEDTRASADRLRGMVQNCERQTRKRITASRGPKGGWGGITMAALRQHMPWLFRAGARERSELEQRFLEHLKNIDERVEGVTATLIAKTVDPQIDELHGRCANSDRRIDAIEREIAAVSARVRDGKTEPGNDVKQRETTA
jgi:hypothetical protein